MREHPVRDPPETDLERRAVVDEPGDVAGDLLRHVLCRRVDVLDDGRVHLDEAVDAVGRDPAVSRVRGIAGLTSAITVRAASAAAFVTSTEIPRLQVPS